MPEVSGHAASQAPGLVLGGAVFSVYLLGTGLYVGLTQLNRPVFWIHLGIALLTLQALPFAIIRLQALTVPIGSATPAWMVAMFLAVPPFVLGIVARGAFVARRRIAADAAALRKTT